jgi:hypothetical protein
LKKDPNKRIGTGTDGFEILKNHPFFNEIDWENLHKQTPPIDFYISKRNNLHSFSPKRKTLFDNIIESKGKKQSFRDKEVSPFQINLIKVDDKDDVVYESIINKLDVLQKKSPWLHYNTRIMKLYSDGRIEYFEPSTKILKGTINLNSECKAIFYDEGKFDLITPLRKFIFKV